MKVCVISTHFAEYGFSLAQALSDRCEVLLVAGEENARMELGSAYRDACLYGGGVQLIHRTRDPKSIARQAQELVRTVRQFAPDIIHVQEDSKDVLAAALPFLPRKPLVLTMHDPKPHAGEDSRARLRTRHGLYVAQLRRRADAALVHGNVLVNDAKEAVRGRGVTVDVIPHGPLGFRHFNPAVQPERGRCLFFGRIQDYKGLDTFVEVINRLHAEGLRVRGVVAGQGPALRNLKAEVKSKGYFELINRFLSAEEAVEQFERADLVLMPYREATQSGVAAFAMGIGRPVVAFNVGALSEFIRNGTTGVLAPPGDVNCFTSATAALLSDDAAKSRMRTAVFELGRGAFSWERIAQRHLAIYDRVAARR